MHAAPHICTPTALDLGTPLTLRSPAFLLILLRTYCTAESHATTKSSACRRHTEIRIIKNRRPIAHCSPSTEPPTTCLLISKTQYQESHTEESGEPLDQ